MTTSVTRPCFTHNTTSDLQDQDQDRLFWSQTGLVLRPTVSDHITVNQGAKVDLIITALVSPNRVCCRQNAVATSDTAAVQRTITHCSKHCRVPAAWEYRLHTRGGGKNLCDPTTYAHTVPLRPMLVRDLFTAANLLVLVVMQHTYELYTS